MQHANFIKLTNAFLFSFLLFTISCTKPANQIPLDTKKIIDSVSIKKADGTYFTSNELQVKIQDFNIDITVPYNTSLNPITPYITITGKTISPASGVQQDFRVPVVYTITAEDGSTAKYTITVHLGNPTALIVYVGSSDNNFYALNALTGALIWKYSGTASFAYSSATYANGTVYVGGIDNYVYAFDAITGAVKWKNLIASTGIESDAVYVDGTIYVGTNDDYLYALDGTSGQVKWKYLTGANVSASPTVSNNTVYFGSSDGKLYALTTTGQLKWSFQTGAMINQSGPSLVNDVIYVGSRDSYLYAINANSGTLIWKYFANGISLEQSSPTVANGIVYIGGWYDLTFKTKGSLYAVNATSGNLVWEKLQNTGISSSPCVANGKLYITADDLKIHALDAATGASLWEKEILPNSASPAVSNGIVYVGGGGSHYFYAFEALTGREIWKFNTVKGLMFSSPLITTASGQADYSGDSGILQ